MSNFKGIELFDIYVCYGPIHGLELECTETSWQAATAKLKSLLAEYRASFGGKHKDARDKGHRTRIERRRVKTGVGAV